MLDLECFYGQERQRLQRLRKFNLSHGRSLQSYVTNLLLLQSHERALDQNVFRFLDKLFFSNTLFTFNDKIILEAYIAHCTYP